MDYANAVYARRATEDIIERKVERWTDAVDARYLAGEITTEQYRVEMDAINRWADMAYSGHS